MKDFYRSKKGLIGGVCAGLYDYTKIPTILWRLAFLIVPSGLWVYVMIWILTEEK